MPRSHAGAAGIVAHGPPSLRATVRIHHSAGPHAATRTDAVADRTGTPGVTSTIAAAPNSVTTGTAGATSRFATTAVTLTCPEISATSGAVTK